MSTLAKPGTTDLITGPFALTRTGLVIEGEPTAEEWQQAGEMLSQAHGALQWWIGDWLLHGEGRPEWGDKYEAACELFGREVEALKNYKWVAGNVKLSTRVDNLSWAHHRLIAPLPPREQKKWLKKAEKEGWSVAELRKAIRQERLDAERTAAKKPSCDAVGVLLADPPWQYDFSETTSREIENQYPTATPEEIALHLGEWGPDLNGDCVLFLWATAPKLREALFVMEAWEFDYKTHAVWDKERLGMGYWFRGQHELLLVGTRGSFSPPDAEDRVSSVFRERRDNKHSKKPMCVYEALEQMFPDATKFEMYQREPREGWLGGGNEL